MLQVTEGPNISTHSCRSCQVIIQYLCRQIGPKVQSCFTFFQHPFLGELKGNKTEYYCEVIRLIDALLLQTTHTAEVSRRQTKFGLFHFVH